MMDESFANGGSGMNAERGAFPQKGQAEDVIKVGVGQENVPQRAVAPVSGGGMKGGKGLDLGAEIGGSIDEKPMPVISAEGDGGLGARGDLASAGVPAIGTGAIPLRQATAGGGAEKTNANGSLSGSLTRRGVRRAFEEEGYFFQNRLFPHLDAGGFGHADTLRGEIGFSRVCFRSSSCS
jgi:hypothetical protein